jgi:RNA polymerase sigma-70 factor, ECF subfamily
MSASDPSRFLHGLANSWPQPELAMVASYGQAQCEASTTEVEAPTFDALYDEYFDFVWRSLKHAKVADAALRDAAQDVWLVVHRRLPEFQRRSPVRSWIYGIIVRVANGYRRTKRRREDPADVADFEKLANPCAASPQQAAERSQSIALVEQLLERLDADKREVFILAELNELTVPEIADLLGTNVNTIYSRLQASRRQFDAALARHRAKSQEKSPCPTS